SFDVWSPARGVHAGFWSIAAGDRKARPLNPRWTAATASSGGYTSFRELDSSARIYLTSKSALILFDNPPPCCVSVSCLLGGTNHSWGDAMSVRKRRWITSKGETKEAWIVDYVDQIGVRHIETFERKKDADEYQATVKVEVRKGTHVAPSKSPTVAEAADTWL